MPWIQYSLIDGSQCATNSVQVDDQILLRLSRAQIYYDGDPTNKMVDISSDPPQVVDVPAHLLPLG